jgi:class 3 adenylate cyclase
MSTSTTTVLFTDLVTSTELSVRFGVRFDEARRAHDALLRSAVEANHGRVIKGTGDGLMATFATAADGIAAARSAQQSIHRLNQQGREPALSIRTGLAVGDVIFEPTDCYGQPVIEAARLCAVAEGDQILATELVRAIAGLHRAEGFKPLGAFELKGLPDPVPVVDIHWERLTRSTTPLPNQLAIPDLSFVGRTAELEQLDRAHEGVRQSGQRQVVLVSGEPGLGKTTIVGHAARGWHEAGTTVAMGRCEEQVRAPYRPFVEALAHLVASAPVELLHRHVNRHGASLLPLVPMLATRLDSVPDRINTDPETERYLLFSAVNDLLASLSEQAPVVLFLDDLHWADAGTTSLLRSLATATEPARLLILGTFRGDEVTGDHPMGQAVAAFRRTPSVTRAELSALSADDILDLLEQLTGPGDGEAATRLAGELVAETGGNAFFVTEVVRHLDETGQLTRLSAATTEGSPLPDSIREVLGERVARLGSAGDAVLGAAAVIGSEFNVPLLVAVTGFDEHKVLGILEDATTVALVRELADASRFRFTHALVQHAILANLGPNRAAGLHRQVAEVLETTSEAGEQVAELAHHWLQATLRSDNARARDWARQAGDAALAALAPGDAVAYFRQALLLHDQLRDDDIPMRLDLLIGLGTAERQAGDPEHRDTLLKAARIARRVGDDQRLAAAALANNIGTFSVFGGIDAERVEMLEAAVARSQVDDERALLLATLANELTYSGDYASRRQLVDDAIAAARASGDATLLLRVLNLVAFPLWVPDTLDERLAMTDESIALMEQVPDPLVRFWVGASHYSSLVQAGRIAEADALLDQTVTLAERLAQPGLQWRARHRVATRQLLRGDPDTAEALAAEALELGTDAGERWATVYFRSQELCVHWMRGTMDELSARIKGTTPRPWHATSPLCLIFAESGRDHEAQALLDRGAAAGFADAPRDPTLVGGLSMFAESAVVLGDLRAAELLHPLLLPYASQVGFDAVSTMGLVDHYVGALAAMLGRHDEAVERLQRSSTFHESIGAPFFEARGRHQLAAALLARQSPGDVEAARDELRQAIVIAERYKYRMVHRRAAQLLATLGDDS